MEKNKFLTALCAFVGFLALVIILWAFLYGCIPGIKNDTDKLFKWGDYKVEQKEEDKEKTDTVSPGTQLKFSNDYIDIIVG